MMYTFSQLGELGRLGNQLWQIASTVGLARMADRDVKFRRDWEYRPFFSIPESFFGDTEGQTYDRKGEFLQELDMWWHIRDEILEMFSPGFGVHDELDSRWNTAVGSADHVTSIHVRRSDYLNVPRRFPVCTQAYYDSAVALALEEHPDTTFLVFSDDINYCINTMFRDRDFRFIPGTIRPLDPARRKGEPQDFWDLFMMARCDQHIIANSSFSWWGATLAGDMSAFYPSVWYGPELSSIDWKNEMILDTWREVQC